VRVIKSIYSLRRFIKTVKAKNKTIGFVPTMGSFHAGHASLMRKCRRENDILIVSIFVNPKQFGNGEDYQTYPREEKKDKYIAREEKVDIIFYPSVEEMYPKRYLTYIDTVKMSDVLCGQCRPGHFQGVTTVVGKLLNIITPDVFYLGRKDAQQAMILKKMVEDLNYSVKIKICPTVREEDGLAMSSRNNYLTFQQRKEAPVIYKALKQARQKAREGQYRPRNIAEGVRTNIEKNSSGRIEYVACVDANSLSPLKKIMGHCMIALAVIFGKVRLIDNIIFKL
jgi:pantoate--beta-alanine ligase